MRKIILLVVSFTTIIIKLDAQIKVGDNPKNIEPSAMLEIESTSKGFLLPRMSSAQRLAILNATQGLEVFDTVTKSLWYYNGTAWIENIGKNIYDSNGDVSPTSAVNRTVTFSNGGSLNFDTNTLFVDATNNRVGIGTNGPGSKLVVQGSTDGAGEKLAVFKGTGNERIRIYDHAASQGPRIELSSGAPSSIENPEGQIVLRPLSSSNSGNYRYVGINTNVGSSPAATIDIKSVGITEAAIKVTNTLNATTFELEDNGELKFSGPLMPNNSAGTTGQILTSAGASASPTWTTLSASNTPNIYSTNGVIAGNRTVDLAGRTLSFTNTTGTAVANQFSVDGATFSVDAANDRVGIGTSTPLRQLHATAGIRAGRSGIGYAELIGGDANTGYVAFNKQDGTRLGYIGYSTTDIKYFAENGADHIFVGATSGDGNVGIGTSPSQKLHVSGTTRMSFDSGTAGTTLLTLDRPNVTNSRVDAIYYATTVGSIPANSLILNSAGSSNPNLIFGRSGNPDIFIKAADGNVGIGTSSPGQKLTVNGTTGLLGAIFRSNLAGGSEFFINPRESDGFTYLNMAPAGLYVRSNDNTLRMTVLNNGNVGIGTNSINAKLHVNGLAGSSSSGQYGYLNAFTSPSGPTGTATGSFAMSIFASDNIVTNQEFRAYSDARIKETKGTVNPQESLDAVANLKIVKYNYKDIKTKGNAIKTGVFAQDVEKVFPEAVQKGKDFIPNVYAKATIKLVGEQSVLEDINSSDVAVGDKIKFYVLENNVETEKTAQVVAVANNQITINEKINATEAFVFGKEVSDFRNLDYDRLTILNLSATQALNAQLEAKNAEIKELKAEKDAEIKTLKAEMDSMKKAIEALKK